MWVNKEFPQHEIACITVCNEHRLAYCLDPDIDRTIASFVQSAARPVNIEIISIIRMYLMQVPFPFQSKLFKNLLQLFIIFKYNLLPYLEKKKLSILLSQQRKTFNLIII